MKPTTHRRYCYIVDLKDDPELIATYKAKHASGKVWQEIIDSIKASGIEVMEIYCSGNRLFMIMEVTDTFDFDQKAKNDASNPRVQEWEKLMWQFQKAVPWAKPGQKWVEMERIFTLDDY